MQNYKKILLGNFQKETILKFFNTLTQPLFQFMDLNAGVWHNREQSNRNSRDVLLEDCSRRPPNW